MIVKDWFFRARYQFLRFSVKENFCGNFIFAGTFFADRGKGLEKTHKSQKLNTVCGIPKLPDICSIKFTPGHLTIKCISYILRKMSNVFNAKRSRLFISVN